MRQTTTHRPHRSRAARLDPYAIEETTITVDQWRRLQDHPELEPPLKVRAHQPHYSAL